MDRIEIELEMWEDAPCPICTRNVDLEKAEKTLYAVMRRDYGYSEDEIKAFINGDIDDEDKKERFSESVFREEEIIVIECGGKYYEDMSEEEYENELALRREEDINEREMQEIIEIVEQIDDKNDELRELFLNLSNKIALREFRSQKTITNDEEIKLEDLGKFKEYLAEIRKFVLFV